MITDDRQLQPYTVHDGLAVFRGEEGEPLLFMPYPHGMSAAGGWVPRAIVEGLASLGWQVITFDPPGVGHSTRPAALGMAEMLACAEEALAVTGVRTPLPVVGHGHSGLAALAFALERPGLAERLVLIGTAASGDSYRRAEGALWNGGHALSRQYALWALLYRLTRRRAPEQRMVDIIRRASFVDQAQARPLEPEPGGWRQAASPRQRWGSIAQRLDYRPFLAKIKAPVLLLVGEYDTMMPPVCSEELFQLLPNAQLERFANSGHYPFLEEPEEFWPPVGDFLGENVLRLGGDDIPAAIRRLLMRIGTSVREGLLLEFAEVEQMEVIEYRGSKYVVIGRDAGAVLCMHGINGVVYAVDPQERLPRRFVNTNLDAFAASMRVYADFRPLLASLGEDQRPGLMERLRRRFLGVDPHVFDSADNWWVTVLGQMAAD